MSTPSYDFYLGLNSSRLFPRIIRTAIQDPSANPANKQRRTSAKQGAWMPAVVIVVVALAVGVVVQ